LWWGEGWGDVGCIGWVFQEGQIRILCKVKYKGKDITKIRAHARQQQSGWFFQEGQIRILYKVKYKGEDIKKIRARARLHHVLADLEDAFAQDSDLAFCFVLFFVFFFHLIPRGSHGRKNKQCWWTL